MWLHPTSCLVCPAVGDIHGDLQKALACLEMAGVLAEDGGHIKWVGGDTVVVQLGDVLDRGDCEIGELSAARPGVAGQALGAGQAGLASRACTSLPLLLLAAPECRCFVCRLPPCSAALLLIPLPCLGAPHLQALCCCCVSWTGRRGRRAARCTCSTATTRA